MSKTYWLGGVAALLWSAAVILPAAAEVPDPDGRTVQRMNELVTLAAPVEPSEYWLGIACSPVPPAVRAQLDLPEKQGVLVEGVVPESPAAKAGIMQHDILLRAGDKPLADPRDLIQAIEATKEGVLKIELLRGGKPKTVKATPAKRPEDARPHAGNMPVPGDREAMEKWMQGMWSGGEGGGDGQRPPMRFRFFHPGAIVPRDVLVPVPLPANMSVMITKEGDQPAKIVVKRGDEKWELTEKELDKLPADVRPHVERMLGRGPLGIVGGIRSLDFMPEGASPDQFDIPVPGPEIKGMPGGGLLERIEKRFDEMNRRMDKMMKQMDELYEEYPHDKAADKPTEKHQEK